MKILVTGGAGFIGLNVVRQLLDAGHDIRVIDLPGQIERADIPSNVEVFVGSILDSVEVHRALRGYDYVVHLAARLGVKRTEVERMICLNVNINGTVNLLEAAVKENIQKIVFASSSEVYGNQAAIPITEKNPVSPISVYAITKLAGEEYLRAYKQEYNLDYSIVRFFNVYGTGQVGQFVIKRFIEAVKKGEAPKIYGDGKQVRCFCHVDDAAKGLISMLFSKETDGRVINIGNDTEPISLQDLANKMIQISGKDIECEFIPYSESDRDSQREIYSRIPSIEKAKKILDYKPNISLEEGIKELFINHDYNHDWVD